MQFILFWGLFSSMYPDFPPGRIDSAYTWSEFGQLIDSATEKTTVTLIERWAALPCGPPNYLWVAGFPNWNITAKNVDSYCGHIHQAVWLTEIQKSWWLRICSAQSTPIETGFGWARCYWLLPGLFRSESRDSWLLFWIQTVSCTTYHLNFSSKHKM